MKKPSRTPRTVDLDIPQPRPAPGPAAANPSNAVRRVFISHSLKDEDFASQLDASLITAGTETFLAERDIRIGDSIPEKIYGGIGTATALIFIISTQSIRSQWVQEELSIAKMRQKQTDGFKIFPVLIDDLDLPPSVLHVRYADFREWREARHYRKACLQLIDAMGIAPHLVGPDDLRWCATWSETLRDLDRILCDDAGVLRGGLDSAQGFTGPQDIFGPVHYATFKQVLDDDYGLLGALKTLSTLIKPRSCSERLLKLRQSAQEAAALAGLLAKNRSHREDYRKAVLLYQKVKRTRDMLRDLRFEFETVVMSTVAIPMEPRSAAARKPLRLKASAASR